MKRCPRCTSISSVWVGPHMHSHRSRTNIRVCLSCANILIRGRISQWWIKCRGCTTYVAEFYKIWLSCRVANMGIEHVFKLHTIGLSRWITQMQTCAWVSDERKIRTRAWAARIWTSAWNASCYGYVLELHKRRLCVWVAQPLSMSMNCTILQTWHL